MIGRLVRRVTGLWPRSEAERLADSMRHMDPYLIAAGFPPGRDPLTGAPWGEMPVVGDDSFELYGASVDLGDPVLNWGCDTHGRYGPCAECQIDSVCASAATPAAGDRPAGVSASPTPPPAGHPTLTSRDLTDAAYVVYGSAHRNSNEPGAERLRALAERLFAAADSNP